MEKETKKTKKIEEVVRAKNALDRLMTLQGIPYKKVYWFDRNRKSLLPHLKKWFEGPAADLFHKWAVPVQPFIPTEKYYDFKKELMDIMAHKITLSKADGDLIVELLNKYEVVPKRMDEPVKEVPMEKRPEFMRETNEAADKYEVEVEFMDIEIDQNMEQILQQLPGEDQIALSFMFKDESMVKVFPKGLQS